MKTISRLNATADNPSLIRIGFQKPSSSEVTDFIAASGVAAKGSTASKWCPILDKLCNPEFCAWGSNGECSVAVLARFSMRGFNKKEARS